MRLIAIFLLMIATPALAVEGYLHESHYSSAICRDQLHGEPTNHGHLRPDCETAFAVIEFDWARPTKIYECLGQALTYAAHTGKLPVCFVMATDSADLALAARFEAAARQGGVRLMVQIVAP